MSHKIMGSMIIDSEELGYVLGSLNGDGSIYVRYPQGTACLCVTDKDFVDYYRAQLSKIFPYKINEYVRKKNNYPSKKMFYIVQFNSFEYCNFLNNFILAHVSGKPHTL